MIFFKEQHWVKREYSILSIKGGNFISFIDIQDPKEFASIVVTESGIIISVNDAQ